MEAADVLSAVALVMLVGAAGALIHLHRLAPDIAPVRDAVSDYGAGTHAQWYRTQVVLLGLATITLWAGLHSAELGGDGSAWLVVFAVSRLLIAGFPVDLPGRPRTRTDTIHNVLAGTAFASIAVAASSLSSWLTTNPGWALDGTWYRRSGWVVAAVAVALAIVWVVPDLRRNVFGLVERCWYAAAIVWLALTAVGLLLS